MAPIAKTSPVKTPSQNSKKRSSPLGSVGQRSAKVSKLSQNAKEVTIHENKAKTKYELASFALKPGLPKGTLLPCREQERHKVSTHLRNGVAMGGSSQVLYISGMPGTGKTAMVMEVLEHMRSQSINFHLVHINAMRLGTPTQVFREISDQLPCAPANNTEARNHVTDFFNTRSEKDPVVILLIDEIDCLKTANQGILYKVFDWLAMPNARLVLASISNTMDLPERLLPRVASRFHIERVDFEPYTRDQIYEILRRRLEAVDALNIFGNIVLQFCAARVAANSGDVRKALQVCRRAIQVCLNEPSIEPGPVKLAHYQVAEKELLFANTMTQAILNLSTLTRHFLAAVVLELRLKDNAEPVMLQTVSARLQKILSMISVDEKRGGAEQADHHSMAECDEMVQQFTERLEAMSILGKGNTPQLTSSDLKTISLGALDLEDLAIALLEKEEDPTIREILEAGGPDLVPGRVFKSID